jgi:uncharacterized beta-barrel protein YwiB (DUF1934 family)
MKKVNEVESKKIGQPVRIRLHSSIRHPGQEIEKHELTATGRLIEKANAFYLKYDENHNGENIQTTLKMSDRDALIMRSGAVKMRLPFDTEQNRAGEYGNGPATFALQVKTNHLEFIEEPKGGQFSVQYELHTEGSLLGTYKLNITYTEGTT